MSSIPQIVRDRLTEKQVEALEAGIHFGNPYKAAKKLGKCERAFQALHARALKEAARIGWAPGQDMVKPAAHGFGVKGTSTLYTMGEDGEKISAQWVKTTREAEDQAEVVRLAVEEWCEAAKGIIRPVKSPKVANDALMTFYPMGDPRVGMCSWAAETGADFDLKIAERDLCAAVDYLVDQSPPSKRAALVNLGDFFHTENLEGVTTRSGHALDTDGQAHQRMQSRQIAPICTPNRHCPRRVDKWTIS